MDFLKLTLVALGFFLCSCQLPYLTQTAYYQSKILLKREDIHQVIANPKTKAEDKRKLNLALQAREFAARDLGLKVKSNYSTFVQLDGPYVSYVVNAAEKYELKNYEWNFPIIGAVPYKGYPQEAQAQNEAKILEQQGFDVHVRGVTAYSTLGWFSDPILSSMLSYTDHDLVNTIIHESVHSTVYIKSNADFNESMASFVGDIGTERYYRKMEGENSPTLELIKYEMADQKLFYSWLKGQMKALEVFYKNLETPNEALRQAAFQRIQKDYSSDVQPFLKSKLYSRFADSPVNNARLLLYKTYSDDVAAFQELYSNCNESIECFLDKIEKIRDEKDPGAALKELNANFPH